MIHCTQESVAHRSEDQAGDQCAKTDIGQEVVGHMNAVITVQKRKATREAVSKHWGWSKQSGRYSGT